MKYLHTMVRVADLDASMDFYCNKLGLEEVVRYDYPEHRFTLVMLAAPGDHEAQVELTYNYDPEEMDGGRNFGHLAYAVGNIYETCQKLMDAGVTINRPPRDGHMAFNSLARRHLGRAFAGRRRAARPGTQGLDGEHRRVVSGSGA